MNKTIKNYPDSFNIIVCKVNNKQDYLYGQYLGTGNPNSKILILGKECAINKETNKWQYEHEVLNNFINWKHNVDNNISIQNADKDELWKTSKHVPVNPLYPYRGQFFKRDRNNNYGTSATWYNYQKLLNKILQDLNIPVPEDKQNKIFFHEYCFLSELNAVTAKYSKDVDSIDREKSIKIRKFLFREDFYQQFPIVIVAAGHYPREFDIDLQKIFSVNWDGDTNNNNNNDKLGRNWYNIHHEITGETPKLLIHTNQLSIVATELLNKIAEESVRFIKEHKIIL